MAARNFTGSARVRAPGSKSGARKISANLADAAARMGDIRAGIAASIEWLRGQNVGVDADVSSTLTLLVRARFPSNSPLQTSLDAHGSVVCDQLIGAMIEAALTGAP